MEINGFTIYDLHLHNDRGDWEIQRTRLRVILNIIATAAITSEQYNDDDDNDGGEWRGNSSNQSCRYWIYKFN